VRPTLVHGARRKQHSKTKQATAATLDITSLPAGGPFFRTPHLPELVAHDAFHSCAKARLVPSDAPRKRHWSLTPLPALWWGHLLMQQHLLALNMAFRSPEDASEWQATPVTYATLPTTKNMLHKSMLSLHKPSPQCAATRLASAPGHSLICLRGAI